MVRQIDGWTTDGQKDRQIASQIDKIISLYIILMGCFGNTIIEIGAVQIKRHTHTQRRRPREIERERDSEPQPPFCPSVCSAIHESQQLTSPMGFPCLKLPPPPGAVLLVYRVDIQNILIHRCRFIVYDFICKYIYTHIYVYIHIYIYIYMYVH